MPAPIEFYFDFSSPYGYIASTRIDAIAARHSRTVNWHPVLLGAVFRVTGGAPLASIPLKGPYSERDMARTARLMGIAFKLPSKFPIPTQAAARLMLWVQGADPQGAKRLAAALYRGYFTEDQDISDPATCADIAAQCGHEREQALAGLNDAGVKDRLRAEIDAAMARGVFGSPYFIVDDEPFWGADRLDQVERWLATGGW
ncbi:MAG: 2-hydroxychromene-2-carboxylate isomerase [Betaproteobacteria bacterium]|nr:2-hydroxychromene-2-carboxylate isomerase [Betaproteobacteria bacterium]